MVNKNLDFSESDTALVVASGDYLSKNPSAGSRLLYRNVPGSRNVVGNYFGGSINHFKSFLEIDTSYLREPFLDNRVSYDEFMDKYHSVIEFVLDNPDCTLDEIKSVGLINSLKFTSGNLNRAKVSLGISPTLSFRETCLSDEVWARRKEDLLSFLKSHPQASRKEIISGHERASALHKFYDSFIVPALIDSGYDEKGIRVFLESYHLDAAKTSAKNFIAFRGNKGLPSPPLEDLAQEASIGIVKCARVKPRMNRYLALKAAHFRMSSYIQRYGYPNSAVKTKSGGRSSVTQDYRGSPSIKTIDDGLINGSNNEKVLAVLRTLDPCSLEYRMLLDDFDEDDFDDSKSAAEEFNGKHNYVPEDSKMPINLFGFSSQAISEALDKSSLSEREKSVLEVLYLSGRELTLEEARKIFGVTRESVRQIEEKALKKLQIPSNKRKFAKNLGLELSDEDEELLSLEEGANLFVEEEGREVA